MTRKRNIRVLGVRPPAEHLLLHDYPGLDRTISVSPNNSRVPCLGLFFVGSILRDELLDLGYEVDIRYLDMAAEDPDTSSEYSGEWSELARVKYGEGVLEKRLLGLPLESLADHVEGVDLVFMSVPFTSNAASAAQTATLLKRIRPKLPIIVGGRDPQHRPDYYLRHQFDVVFLGQAEGLVGRVCDQLLKRRSLPAIPGVMTRHYASPRAAKSPVQFHSSVLTLRSGDPGFLTTPDLRRQTNPYFGETDLEMYNQSSDGPWPEGVSGPAMWYLSSVGCPRECAFCVSAHSPYLALTANRVREVLEHYASHGIRTLLSAEDNFLARLLRHPGEAEREIIEIADIIVDLGFAHEFTDGIEVGLLMNSKGKLRTRLIERLFRVEKNAGRINGTYRMYWPIETFTERNKFSKLRVLSDHEQILEAVLDQGIPHIGFGVILFRDLDEDQLKHFEEGLQNFCEWMHQHSGNTQWRIAIFHELPLPGAQNFETMTGGLEFDIDMHPELWALPINPVNGTHYSYDELFSIKRTLLRRYDPGLLQSWDDGGIYSLR